MYKEGMIVIIKPTIPSKISQIKLYSEIILYKYPSIQTILSIVSTGGERVKMLGNDYRLMSGSDI